ncbi:lysis protein [Alloalcanivorax sp. C16-1]|uniref:lysis protein n=1 Tax=Alloalcanivorax sp. C16-1 TaxID=3390051 RepID=UPI003970F68A
MVWLRLLAVLAVVGVIFGLGWMLGTAQVGEEFATFRAVQAGQLADAEAAARAAEHRLGEAVAAVDARYTQELSDAHAEIDRLRDDVAAGRRRLSVNAQCLPGTADDSRAAGVGDAAGPRLTDSAQRDYWRLRSRIETITSQLAACQDYARAVTAGSPPEVSE